MAGELGTARIYWAGSHATQRLASPLGKVHSEGLRLLRDHGWVCTRDDPRVPGWAFTTRKAANFAAAGPGLPKVRQLPQACSAVLDYKRRLAEVLEAAGCTHIAPRTWPDACAFLQQHRGGGGSGGDVDGCGPEAAAARAASSAAAGAPEGRLYFLKHRLGVKGQAVYAFASLPPLLDQLQRLCTDERGGSVGSSTAAAGRQFVVQEGVAPPLLLPDGRKFTLRAHVLLLLHGEGAAAQQAQQEEQAQQPQQAGRQQQGQQQPGRLVHEDVIVTPHARAPQQGVPPPDSSSPSGGSGLGPAAAAAAAAEADPAVHISSRGSSHPQPFLLAQLSLAAHQQQQPTNDRPASGDAALRRELWDQLCHVCRVAVAAAAPRGLVPPGADPHAVFCHLMAFDLGVAAAGPQPRLTAAPATPGPVTAATATAAGAPGSAPASPTAATTEQRGVPCKASAPRVLLLEANSYPAIASGTMAAVPRVVYTRLVGDVLTLAVLPALGGAPPVAGGFRPVL